MGVGGTAVLGFRVQGLGSNTGALTIRIGFWGEKNFIYIYIYIYLYLFIYLCTYIF